MLGRVDINDELLADWRCWQYERKTQNETDTVNPPFTVLSLSLKLEFDI